MNFVDKEELNVQKNFIDKGYYIFNIKDKKNLYKIKKTIIKISNDWLKKKYKKKIKKFSLNKTHNVIPIKDLNSYRLYVYEKIN